MEQSVELTEHEALFLVVHMYVFYGSILVLSLIFLWREFVWNLSLKWLFAIKLYFVRKVSFNLFSNLILLFLPEVLVVCA